MLDALVAIALLFSLEYWTVFNKHVLENLSFLEFIRLVTHTFLVTMCFCIIAYTRFTEEHFRWSRVHTLVYTV